MNRNSSCREVKIGDEDWKIEIITTADTKVDKDLDKLKKAKAWATANGFDRFRVTKFNMDDPKDKPDFTKTVNV